MIEVKYKYNTESDSKYPIHVQLNFYGNMDDDEKLCYIKEFQVKENELEYLIFDLFRVLIRVTKIDVNGT